MTSRQILSPTACSLRVVLAPLAPEADGRRLWLSQWSDSRGEVRDNELILRVGDPETAQRLERVACGETRRSARRGTPAHYRQELRATRACLAALGWTLTDDEERVLAPLEEYAHRPDPSPRVARPES
jgi:hypothetical protein